MGGVGGWCVVVTHVILGSVLSGLTLGLWTLDFGLGLDNIFQEIPEKDGKCYVFHGSYWQILAN